MFVFLYKGCGKRFVQTTISASDWPYLKPVAENRFLCLTVSLEKSRSTEASGSCTKKGMLVVVLERRATALHFSIMHHCHRSYTTAKTNPSPKGRWTREIATMPNTLHMLARSIYSETIKTKSLFSLNVLSSLTDSEHKFMNRSSKESSDNR